MAVKRIWRGWTSRENADVYRRLLEDEVFPSIEAKRIPGYQSIELLSRELGDSPDGEVEFMTVMTFDSLESVHYIAVAIVTTDERHSRRGHDSIFLRYSFVCVGARAQLPFCASVRHRTADFQKM